MNFTALNIFEFHYFIRYDFMSLGYLILLLYVTTHQVIPTINALLMEAISTSVTSKTQQDIFSSKCYRQPI